jgi:hypothetical protein
MKATFLVQDEEPGEDAPGTFRTLKITTPTPTSVSGSSSGEENGIRQRKTKSKGNAKKGQEEEEVKLKDPKEEMKGDPYVKKEMKQKDPLYWFGYLPPQTLRSAQKHFITGE